MKRLRYLLGQAPLVASVLLFSANSAWAQTATVNVTSTKQLIRGFGGMNHPIWAGDLTADQRTTAFGNAQGQLGMSVLRVFISDNKNDWTKEVATAKRAAELGAIVFATPWNPPASMTETVSGQKKLRKDQYAAWATYLSDFNTFMKSNGVNLYAVSIQNEPDYAQDWTAWSQDDVYDFTLNNAGAITADRVITAESFNYTKSYYDKILNDPKALANIDIVGTHLYGTAVSAFPYPLFDSKGAGKERWMTEHYTDSKNDADLWPMALDVAYEMHNAMVEAQFNAYVWWYIRRSYSPMKENGTLSKRGYCFAQFSKFVRPGFMRVDAAKNPTTDVYVSAYKGSSDVVLIAVNRSTQAKAITLAVSGSNIASYERYTTSSSKSLSNDGNVQASNGSLAVTLDAQSVTTLRGTSTTGSGGATGAGGATGTGGATGSGGAIGAGGAKTSGGSPSTGGASSAGGAKSSGGANNSGGANPSAGANNSGGANPSAGASNGSGGLIGAGGTAGADGSASGGSANNGGTSNANGGSIASGGSPLSTGGAGSGGSLGAGGSSASSGGQGTPSDPASENGCSCRVYGAPSNASPFALLGMVGVIALGSARRSKRRE